MQDEKEKIPDEDVAADATASGGGEKAADHDRKTSTDKPADPDPDEAPEEAGSPT